MNFTFIARCVRTALSCVALVSPTALLAATEAGPETYLSAVLHAKPGDVIRLKPGEYQDGLPIREINGKGNERVIIEAADPSSPPLFLATPDRNTISIVNSSYVTIKNLVLDGRNLPVDAVKAEQRGRFAHHITVEGLRIVRYGYSQFTIGISTKCPAWGWIIRRNVIVAPGTGMYLGNSDGRDPFIGGLIEYNLIVDPIGYGIQIKHQSSRSGETGEPIDPQVTIIRHNVVSKFSNGSDGHLARPNVLVGHFPPSGAGKDDRYLIYGNFLYANRTEALFQGEGNIALYANLFINPFGDAVHIQPHYDVPRNIWLFNNTVVAAEDGIGLRGHIEDYLRLLQGNIVFARRDASKSYSGNLTGPFQDADKYLRAPSEPPGRLDLRLRKPLLGMSSGKAVLSEPWVDSQRDFDGRPVAYGDIGAYARAGLLTWSPSIAMKPLTRRQ